MRNKKFRERYQIEEKNKDYGYIKQFEKCPHSPNIWQKRRNVLCYKRLR